MRPGLPAGEHMLAPLTPVHLGRRRLPNSLHPGGLALLGSLARADVTGGRVRAPLGLHYGSTREPFQQDHSLANLIQLGLLWVCQNHWGHGKMILIKFCPLEMLWGSSYDFFCFLC